MQAGAEKRALVLCAVLVVLMAAVVLRAGYSHVVTGGELDARAQRQHFERVEEEAPRGRILDRNGRILAASYHARSLAVDPSLVEDPDRYAYALTLLLGEPEGAGPLAGRIRSAQRKGSRFLWVRRRLDRDRAARIARSGLPALDLREEMRREYPHGTDGLAWIGLVGLRPDGFTGKGLIGLEARLDRRLSGNTGARVVLRDGRTRQRLHLFPERERNASAGSDLRTCVDVRIQALAEQALDDLQKEFTPKWSCALVLDPRNGEILALAGRPLLDPSRLRGGDEDRSALRVPAIHCIYEPGSTIKPLIMAAALTAGVVSPDEVIDCGPGWALFGGRTLRDVRPRGQLVLPEVLVKSSNIGMARLGLRLGMDRAHDLLRAAGFGRPTGIVLPLEERGQVTPRPKWRPNQTLVSVSMGHEVAVTPLQMALAVSALLNGGVVHRPKLLAGGNEEGRKLPLSPSALAFVRSAMVRVVEEGNVKTARIRGVEVGGKTGTSGKYPKGCGKYDSSFFCFAPARNPRLLVLVVADEPQRRDGGCPYGSVVAAPVAGRLLAGALRLFDHDSDSYGFATPSGSGVRHVGNVSAEWCVSRRTSKRVRTPEGGSLRQWAGTRTRKASLETVNHVVGSRDD